ncbi:Aspartate ammonia-lyase [Clavibacter michiganensis]|uniref:Aspartate ammonia-lyase n=1 Tax=Clavibacter michiganensis TaxID=28447 RepID=A0A251XVQ5_9MICO|nr:Aspartate ammonia-lyase [Clavibacter michiganensis]
MTPVSPNDDRIPTPDGHPVRTETDSLGSLDVPADAYWGIHTARALENFPISLRPLSVYPSSWWRSRR